MKQDTTLKEIPEDVANGCPDFCKNCNKKLIAVFRKWQNDTCKVEFCHEDETECIVIYSTKVHFINY